MMDLHYRLFKKNKNLSIHAKEIWTRKNKNSKQHLLIITYLFVLHKGTGFHYPLGDNSYKLDK